MKSPAMSHFGRAGTARLPAGSIALAVIFAVVLTCASGVATEVAPVRRPSVKDSPGWTPPADPESTAERIGRRMNAPLVTRTFTGGARSMDELGRTLCRLLHHSDRDSLLALCVNDIEFRAILWREFPQSRPATGLQWQDGWTILGARLIDGTGHAVRDYGGHVYQFQGFEVDSVATYRNFRLHLGVRLVATDDTGQLQRMTWLRGIAERKGRFKIYSTDD